MASDLPVSMKVVVAGGYAVGKTTLTSRELREELGLSPAATSNLLARWRRAGLVDQVARGRYAIRQIGLLGTRASSEDVALAVAALVDGRPHRIAFHSALDFHGLLVRPVRTVQIASPHRFTSIEVSGRPLKVVFERADTVEIGTEDDQLATVGQPVHGCRDGLGIGGSGEDDQGGGEQPRIAAPGSRIVGVQFYQPRHLLLGVAHQWHERKYLAADPRQGQQPVVTVGQVRSLVGQDRIQLGGIERLHRTGGQDHRGLAASHAVGRGLSMLH